MLSDTGNLWEANNRHHKINKQIKIKTWWNLEIVKYHDNYLLQQFYRNSLKKPWAKLPLIRFFFSSNSFTVYRLLGLCCKHLYFLTGPDHLLWQRGIKPGWLERPQQDWDYDNFIERNQIFLISLSETVYSNYCQDTKMFANLQGKQSNV